MAGPGRFFFRDVLPIPAMVAMECVNVGLNTLFKAATNAGMSYHVFIVYSYALAALALLPSPFISRRSRTLPPLNFSTLSKIALLSLIGFGSQMMVYKGITYSSPTLASALSNLVPAFTFVLAVLLRMEKVVWKSSSSQAKVMGTIISILGAFVVTFYKGPKLIYSSSPPISALSSSLHDLHEAPLISSSSSSSPDLNWVIGSLLFSGEYILYPLWYILQTRIIKEYPEEATVILVYCLGVAAMGAVVGVVVEPDSSAWVLSKTVALASVFCSGLLGSGLSNTLHTWALRLKGPVFVAMFKPLSVVVAVVMGVLFLGDALYLGSLIGASVISMGFYAVMWGKAREEILEEEEEENHDNHSFSTNTVFHSDEKVPLLRSYNTIETQRYSSDHV